MNDSLIAPLVGVVLLFIGIAMMRAHARTWSRQKNDPALDDDDRLHYYSRYRRRMQTSGMIALLGLLIPVGDQLILMKKAPGWVAGYWVAVLVLLAWVILRGLGDFAATTAYTRASLARVRQKQRALEQKLAELRSRKSNGHHQPE